MEFPRGTGILPVLALEKRDMKPPESAQPPRGATLAQSAAAHSILAGALVGAASSLVIFLICAIAIHHRTGVLAFNSDDSYIYTGYVKMAFTPGAGLFSYNVGEHSAGTTGILFYYLLAAGYRVVTLVLPAGPFALVLNSWIVSGTCFTLTGAVMGGVIVSTCRWLQVNSRAIAYAMILVGVGLLCASSSFLWGQMSGMENPLSALLVTSLAAIALAQQPNLPLASALAAALVATRPDWAPIALLVPGLSLTRTRLPRARRLRDLAVGYFLFFSLLIAAFLPLRLTTGQWQPAALGARVELHLVGSATEFADAIVAVFFNWWGTALVASWIVCVIPFGRPATRPGQFFIPLFITLFFLMRSATGLEVFNVRDRYVSYLWPPLAMTYALALVAVVKGRLSKRATPLAAMGDVVVLAVALLLFGSISTVNNVSNDTIEMLQVHVRPSQWMSENLPSGAIVAMEPAGALRTYTDFRLVDRTGLTTNHHRHYLDSTGKRPDEKGNFLGFLRANGVQYLFDYPRHETFDGNWDTFQVRKVWTPTPRIHSLGQIDLVEIITQK